MTNEQIYFFNNVTFLVDTREKENYDVLREIAHFGGKFRVETFTTGDYSFEIDGESFKGKWLGERKGSLSEIYGNVMAKNKHSDHDERNNLEEELKRAHDGGVDEFVLFIQGVDNLADVKDFRLKRATKQGERAGMHIYSTLMSWCQNNRYGFRIICATEQSDLAREMIAHAYYYWRNEMKKRYGDNFLKTLIKRVDVLP